MVCNRCNTVLSRDNMYDLPRNFIELYCMTCGERIWIDRSRFVWDLAWS